MATVKKRKSVVIDVEKLGPLHTVSGNAKWCRCYGKQYEDFLKKLKVELSYDPAISLLGIYPKEWKSGPQRAISTSLLIAALFPIATWTNNLNIHQQMSG